MSQLIGQDFLERLAPDCKVVVHSGELGIIDRDAADRGCMRRNGRDLELDSLFWQIGACDVGVYRDRPSPHPDAIEIVDDLWFPDAHFGIVGSQQVAAQSP